jgi:signal transduction histidine kinase
MPASLLGKKTGSSTVTVSAATPNLQENLRRLDQLANLGLVAASAAHEIKNGLVAVSTFVELAAQKSDDPELAALVGRELRRINGLVTQMLRFAAPKPAAFAPVFVHELLDHSLRLLEHQMNGQMIVLKRDFAATPDTVLGDESQLQQAFMNLLLNAVEAIGNHGELAVTTQTAADSQGRNRLNLLIRDSGPGIAMENLPRLFEPFFTTKKNGTGLGLAISRRVVEEHFGTIEIQSAIGSGTTFTISLPAD